MAAVGEDENEEEDVVEGRQAGRRTATSSVQSACEGPTHFKLRNVALLVPVGQGAHSPASASPLRPRRRLPVIALHVAPPRTHNLRDTPPDVSRRTEPALPDEDPGACELSKRESPNLTCADAAYSNSHRPLTASVSFGAEHLCAIHVAIVHVYTVHVLQCIINRDVTSFSGLVASLCSGVPLGLGHFHPQAALPHARQHLEMQRDHTRGVSRTSAYSVKCALGIIFSFPF